MCARCVHGHALCQVLAHASPYYFRDFEKNKNNMNATIQLEVYFSMSVNCRSVDGTPTSGRSVADLHLRQRTDDGSRHRAAIIGIVGPLATRLLCADWDDDYNDDDAEWHDDDNNDDDVKWNDDDDNDDDAKWDDDDDNDDDAKWDDDDNDDDAKWDACEQDDKKTSKACGSRKGKGRQRKETTRGK